MMKYEDLIKQMTLEEKAAMCSGEDFWHFKGLERLGLPHIAVSDGPHGLRDQIGGKADHLGINASAPATCFPSAATTACAWDEEIVALMAKAIAAEAKAAGISIVLGPGINMKRSPLCGRNFEYFSEDPFLAGKLSVAYVNAMQEEGIGTSLKHYAVNSQENKRMTISEEVDERTLREIYLPAFEMTVKEAQPWTVMNAYNRLSGEYCGENQWLLTDVLKKEWDYKGIVITDWGAENDIVKGIQNGQHIEMPSSKEVGPSKLIQAVKAGNLDESILDQRVNDIIDIIMRAKETLDKNETIAFSKEEHHALAHKIAAESMVLLKNENQTLPLQKEKSYAIIGEMAVSPRYQGSGSSKINPTSVEDAFTALKASGVQCEYAQGYEKTTDKPNDMLISEAQALAKRHDAVILFVGLTESYEAEGFDRTHLRMPKSHLELISKIARVNANLIVVLAGGAPMEMPWIGQAKAVLHSYLGGQATGLAVADLLTGKINPSGKLAETFPLRLEDAPSYRYFNDNPVSALHKEGLYIGYRYYDTAKRNVLFPFGFGLSYTSFKYSGLKVTPKNIRSADSLDKVKVSFKIKNTGKVDGAESCQIYVKDNEHTAYRPEKELKGFSKVFLKSGEETTVEIMLNKRAFAYFNSEMSDWHIENGTFTILVGASSRDIRLQETMKVTLPKNEVAISDDAKRLPTYMNGEISYVSNKEFLTLLGREKMPNTAFAKDHIFDRNSSLEDAKDTKYGKYLYNIIRKVVARAASFETNPEMIAQTGMQMPLRAFVGQSQGVFSEEMLQNLINILNNQKAGKNMLKLMTGFARAIVLLPEVIRQM